MGGAPPHTPVAHPEEPVYQPGREVWPVERFLQEEPLRMVSEYQDRYEFFPNHHSPPSSPAGGESPNHTQYASPELRE